MPRNYDPTGNGGSEPARDSLELASLASSSSRPSLASNSSRSGISSSRRLSLESNENNSTRNNDDGGDEGDHRPRHYRSYSVSSAFDFNSHLIPLTTSSGASSYAPLPSTSGGGAGRGGGAHGGQGGSLLERRKTLTFTNSLSLLLSLQIGSGIFSSPSQVNNHAGSPGMSLVIWVLAGLLAWTGAASYAELGGAIPLNGGAQAYLRYTFGEGAAFVFAWTAVTVLKPGSAAIIAIIFGEYFNRVLLGGADVVGDWGNKLTAIIALLVVTVLNAVSTRLTARLSEVFMVLKIGSLIAVTVIGIVVAATGWSGDGEGPSTEWKDRNWFAPVLVGNGTDVSGGEADNSSGNIRQTLQLGEIALALYAGLWAFDGWDNVNYVTGEMRHPSRDLPLVIHIAMPTVITCYLLANTAYYLVLPASVVGLSNTVAVAFGYKVFGAPGAILFALTVSMSCFGALNATTFTSGRLVYVAGKEGYLPQVFGRLGWFPSRKSADHNYHNQPSRSRATNGAITKLKARLADGPWHATPIPAILLNTFITSLYILVGSFSTLITFYGVAGYTFYFLTVLGLIVLRARQPELERPYKTWITTPICFCCVSLFLVTRGVFAAPVESVAVLGFVGVGWPLYYWRVGGGWKGFWEDVGSIGGTVKGWVGWGKGKGRAR